MPTGGLRKGFRRKASRVTDQSSLERLIAEDSQEDLQLVDVKRKPRVSVTHRGSAITIPTSGGGTDSDYVPKTKVKVRDEGIQVALVDYDKKLKHQQIKIKKLSQDNVKLETQVRGYEQRFRDMRNDAVYHDLTAKDNHDEGFCAPVVEAWRSFKALFYTAWFQCWFKIQVKLEEKHREISKEETRRDTEARDSITQTQ